MKSLTVPALIDTLTILDIALEQYDKAQEQLERAKLPYTHAISVLEDSMQTDDTVLEAQDLVEEYKDLFEIARLEAGNDAVEAWEKGQTEGVKEWSQDGWQVRLRTTKTPRVESIPEVLAHLVEADATEAAVKSVTFHKATVVKLHEAIKGGIRGLEVEEKTSASLKKS